MKIELINGAQTVPDSKSPLAALINFYHAFNHQDMSEMSQNWAHSADVSMSNPLGGVKRGWHQIESVYRHIFGGPAEVYVEFYDFNLHETNDMFTAAGREKGHFRSQGNEIELAIRTTRVYQHIDQQWKQIHHHGSIDHPELLNNYQRAVLGKTTAQIAI